uniref:hypothetical protein n=1 Tax=Escherichia coli TaxID=562 RepID=UPI002D7F2C12|nr:hypothetical protein [Escherichia coli]UGK56133.1 hypothetical protein [Escherichia coli]UGK56524.1 hypothetical protein [Escherichia coli]
MELTNNRDDLSGLGEEEANSGKGKSAVNDSQYPAQLTPPGAVQYPKSSVLVNKPVTYTTTEVKPVGQLPVMYDQTLKKWGRQLQQLDHGQSAGILLILMYG